MKIKEYNNFSIIADLIWGITVLNGTSYVVFILHRSGWWFLFALLLLSASFPIKVIEKDGD